MKKENNIRKGIHTRLTRRVLSIALAVMLVAGMIVFGTVFAADNITGKLTYTFTAYQDDKLIPTGATNLKFGYDRLKLVVNWSFNDGTLITDGDYLLLPMTFAEPVNFNMNNYSFDFSAEKAGVAGTAGKVTLEPTTSGTNKDKLFNIRVVFNGYLEGTNNISGVFEFTFRCEADNPESVPQEWKVNGVTLAKGTTEKNDWNGHRIGSEKFNKTIDKDGDPFEVEDVVDGKNIILWSAQVNGTGLSEANYFMEYKGNNGYNGTTIPATVTIYDKLDSTQLLAPYKLYDWDGNPVIPLDISRFMYGAGGTAYFQAYTVDLEKLWEFCMDDKSMEFARTLLGWSARMNAADYRLDYESHTPTPNKSNGFPMTFYMNMFVREMMDRYALLGSRALTNSGGTNLYTEARYKTQIDFFFDNVVRSVADDISAVQIGKDSFSFDITSAAFDGRALYVSYFAEVTNPALLPSNLQVQNRIGIEFGGVNKEVGPHDKTYWFDGNGYAVGDYNNLTIFKKSDSTGSLAGAEFKVERLGVWNDSDYTNAYPMTPMIITTSGISGVYSATTGLLGTYTKDDIYKITEITPPLDHIAYADPIFLKIDPTNNYAVTLTDDKGDPITLATDEYGLCKALGVPDPAGTHIYVVNEKIPAEPVIPTGSLTVSKVLAGVDPEFGRDFTFTVTFSDGGTYDGVADGSSFTLKGSESKTINGIPHGVEYEVTEADYSIDRYATSSVGESGEITGTPSAAVFTNTRSAPPPPPPGSLKVSKVLEGDNTESSKDFTFTVTFSDGGTYDGVANGSSFTLKGGEHKTITGISHGVDYTVTEAEAGADGYTTTAVGESGTIESLTQSDAVFTNTRNIIPATTSSLTVSKALAGDDTEPGRAFSFKVDFTPAGIYDGYSSGDTFTLVGGASKTITGIPFDVSYIVTELDADTDRYVTTSDNATGTITTTPNNAVFTNTRNAIPKGNLTVSKVLAGTDPDPGMDFTFTVTFSGGGTYDGYTSGTPFTLKGGESKTINNIPQGAEYTVTEADYTSEGYETTSEGENGEITGTPSTAIFTNAKDKTEPPETPTGNLTVSKVLSGNNVETGKDFTFTVTFSGGGTYDGYTTGTPFTLKGGESKTLTGIPHGVAYEVKETDANTDGYTTTSTDASGVITGTPSEAVFTNTRNKVITPPPPTVEPSTSPSPTPEPSSTPDPSPSPSTTPEPEPYDPPPTPGAGPSPDPEPEPEPEPEPLIPLPQQRIPGGNIQSEPPAPTGDDNNLVWDDDLEMWIEFDEDGVPLGGWYWCDDNEMWIFDEEIPLGALEFDEEDPPEDPEPEVKELPQTGRGLTPELICLIGLSLLGIGVTLSAGTKKRGKRD